MKQSLINSNLQKGVIIVYRCKFDEREKCFASLLELCSKLHVHAYTCIGVW